MRVRILAAALTAAAALPISTPAAAGSVPVDYTLSVTGNGQTVTLGTLVLNYDGSTYSLDSLDLTIKGKSAIVTSDVTLSPVLGTDDYCLYTFSSCSVVSEENSLYFIFDPSLVSQTTTLYGYSTKDLATESLPLTIEQAAVPEPGTWALMLLGFGLIGAVTRAHRSASRLKRRAILKSLGDQQPGLGGHWLG